MRAREFLAERAAPQYYIHATRPEAIPSILKKGLIPNATNDGEGNYTDSLDWLSLEGVYATKQPSLTQSYLRAHDLLDHFALCVLSISQGSALPDEDTINILLRKCHQRVCDSWGVDTSYYESIEHYFAEREMHDEPHDPYDDDGEPAAELTPEIFWKQVAEEFHELAKSPSDPRPADMKLLDELCDNWHGVAFVDGGDADPFYWKDLKDRVVRRYPRMAHPEFGHGWSVRIPGAVTFSGRNRIAAVVEVEDGHATLVWGKLPAETKELFRSLVDNLD